MERLGGMLVALYPEAVEHIHVTLAGGEPIHRGQSTLLSVTRAGRQRKAACRHTTVEGSGDHSPGRVARSDRRSHCHGGWQLVDPLIRQSTTRQACGRSSSRSYLPAHERKSPSTFNETPLGIYICAPSKAQSAQPIREEDMARQQWTRREALKAGAAVTLPLLVPNHVLGGKETPPSETVRVGLIGCGGRGDTSAPSSRSTSPVSASSPPATASCPRRSLRQGFLERGQVGRLRRLPQHDRNGEA